MSELLIGTDRGVFRLGNDGNIQPGGGTANGGIYDARP